MALAGRRGGGLAGLAGACQSGGRGGGWVPVFGDWWRQAPDQRQNARRWRLASVSGRRWRVAIRHGCRLARARQTAQIRQRSGGVCGHDPGGTAGWRCVPVWRAGWRLGASLRRLVAPGARSAPKRAEVAAGGGFRAGVADSDQAQSQGGVHQPHNANQAEIRWCLRAWPWRDGGAGGCVPVWRAEWRLGASLRRSVASGARSAPKRAEVAAGDGFGAKVAHPWSSQTSMATAQDRHAAYGGGHRWVKQRDDGCRHLFGADRNE
jgi:hypothetical protein